MAPVLDALRRPRIALPCMVIAFAVVVAALAPLIATDPLHIDAYQRLMAPGAGHLFGTDQFGRDVFSRTAYGARVSLLVGFTVTIVVTFVGVSIGLLSGTLPRLDAILMRIMDAVMAIPSILLAIAFLALLGAGILNAIIAIIIPEIPRMARVVRGVTLSIRERPFVDAAITSGASPARVLLRHILPLAVMAIVVQATFVFASAVIAEAILSFLGAGAPPEVPSWGNIISEGRMLLQIAPWVVAAPGICLAGLVLTVNALGDAIADELDPRLRRQHGR